MKRRLLTVLPVVVVVVVAVLIWWLLLGGESAPQPEEVEADETGSVALSGRVVDSSGRGVAGARVFAEEAVTKADEDGSFAFSELPADTLRIDATAEGYRRGGVDDRGRPTVDLSEGETVEDLELMLPEAASVSGRIVAGGEPVEEARISLSYVFAEGLEGNELDPYIVSGRATSGEDGRFSIDQIAPGRLQILVESDEHSFTESDDLYFRPGQHREDVVVDMAPSGGLRGTIETTDGGNPSAEVWLDPADPESPVREVDIEDGSFSVRDLTEGTYSVRIEAPEYRDETVEGVEVEADEVNEVDIELEPSRGLFGRVVEPDGTPVTDAHVVVRNGERGRRLRVDDQGRFEWNDIEEGDWRGRASAPGHQPSETRQLELDREEVFEIRSGGTIEGRVEDADGDPVSDFDIEVASMELDESRGYRARHMPSERVTGADEGRFTFGPLQSGRYRLLVEAGDRTPATTDAIDVEAGNRSGPVVVRLEEGGALTGVVRDAKTGEPIEGAEVRYVMSTPDNRPPRTRTDDQGRYRLEDLPSGRSSIRVAHGYYVHEVVGGLHVPNGGELTYDIELQSVEDKGRPGQNMQGVGATLRSVDEGFRIQGLMEGAAAEAAGLEEGDVVTGVDGESVDEMTVDQVVELIRGEPGTGVELEVQRSGRGTRTIEVEREKVFIPSDRPMRPRPGD